MIICLARTAQFMSELSKAWSICFLTLDLKMALSVVAAAMGNLQNKFALLSTSLHFPSPDRQTDGRTNRRSAMRNADS